MRNMKRWIAFLLIIMMAVSLAGCQKEEEKEETAAEKYSRAQALMSKNQFAEAAAVFDLLGSYEESSKLAMYCKAAQAGEEGDYDTALSTFGLLEDYKESKFMISYYKARRTESTGASDENNYINWIKAADLYDEIALFRDSKDRADSCRKQVYDFAVKLAEEGNYNDAIFALRYLEDYNDCVLLSRYYQANYYAMQGRFTEASEVYKGLGDYKDSAEQVTLVLERGYANAEALEESGDQDGASKVFQELGDYKDSYDRAFKPFYTQGEALRDAQKWDEAAAAFEKAGNYSDAKDQILETRLLEGQTKRDSHDWIGAMNAYLKAGVDNPRVHTEIAATYYARAVVQRDEKEWDNAIDSFLTAGNYEDAPEQVLLTLCSKGEALREAQEWDAAREAFSMMGAENEETWPLIYATYYAEGEAKKAAKDWDGAIWAFECAGDYQDAKEQVMETKYLKAKALESEGKTQEAYSVFRGIQGYKDVDKILTGEDYAKLNIIKRYVE